MKYDKFKVYLYFCMSVFFLLLFVTFYHSFGYKYDFLTGKSYRSGGMVIQATPRDAVITKDGQIIENSSFLGGLFASFIKIDDLEPNIYDIKVNKEGYSQWQKNIDIKPGQVEKYEHIVLLKKEYTHQPVLPDISLPAYGKTWVSQEKNRIIFEGAVGQQQGLFMVDIASEKHSRVLDKDQIGMMGEIKDVFWTEDDGRVVLVTASDMYLIDIRDNGRIYLIPAAVSSVLRQNAAPIYLFDKFVIYGKAGSVYSLDYVTKENKKLMDGVNSFFVNQGVLYFFRSEPAALSPDLFSTNLGDLSYSVRITSMPENYHPDAPFTVERYGRTLIVLSEGSLYFVGRDGKTGKINSNAKTAHFFQGGKRIIYYNDNEIWIYYVEDKTSDPVKSKGENELLTRFSGTLGNIYLYADEENLFYQENNIFKFTELDGRDRRNTCDLLENRDNIGIFYIRNRNYLYFIRDGKFLRINLNEA